MVGVLILTWVDTVVISSKSIMATWKVENFRMLFWKVKSFIIDLEDVSLLWSNNGNIASVNVCEWDETEFMSIIQKKQLQLFCALFLLKYWEKL